MYTDTMPVNPLLAKVSDADAIRVLEGSSDTLAHATRPAFLDNDDCPVLWSNNDWDTLEANRNNLLNLDAVRTQFDRERFMIDGYAVFEGVIAPDACSEWLAALTRGQQLNDRLLQSDWSKIDWHGLGRSQPTEQVAESDLRRALGGSQALPQQTDVAGVRTLRLHSVFAEYFPAGHLSFMMNVITHPDMLELQRLCLGHEVVYFDHNQLLSRPGGYGGGAWHSHRIGSDYDDGIASIEEYDVQPNALLTLCYVNGFDSYEDGGLKIIRGSHLYRDPEGCTGATDDDMTRGWLANRRHPVTGKPLEIEHLSLPPGSIVCCLSHAAHAVAPKAVERTTRLCALICYRKATIHGYAQPPSAVPPVWAMKAQRNELPPVLTQLLRPSFDRKLTSGKTESAE